MLHGGTRQCFEASAAQRVCAGSPRASSAALHPPARTHRARTHRTTTAECLTGRRCTLPASAAAFGTDGGASDPAAAPLIRRVHHRQVDLKLPAATASGSSPTFGHPHAPVHRRSPPPSWHGRGVALARPACSAAAVHHALVCSSRRTACGPAHARASRCVHAQRAAVHVAWHAFVCVRGGQAPSSYSLAARSPWPRTPTCPRFAAAPFVRPCAVQLAGLQEGDA